MKNPDEHILYKTKQHKIVLFLNFLRSFIIL